MNSLVLRTRPATGFVDIGIALPGTYDASCPPNPGNSNSAPDDTRQLGVLDTPLPTPRDCRVPVPLPWRCGPSPSRERGSADVLSIQPGAKPPRVLTSSRDAPRRE